jgi:RNA polymerase sigma-70 factor (ECF subfamily)
MRSTSCSVLASAVTAASRGRAATGTWSSRQRAAIAASFRSRSDSAAFAASEAFQEAVVLRDLQEMSYAEIAAALGIPVGTVMSRIHRGRALLREALAGRKP